ncbi:hypothetical protein GALMADRAFT_256619 [Galerina marginata CBS 339.88]|uniref:Uncharacterized protein n=1 Tax=Galerina marginata (strain CBS 339.88) TaxID=685588 RepID=A0A067SPQ5_GALM3|nr:hypothetical protein GALMADRAFT_256619 [Galerina marginata CBS 339.88]
MLPIVFSILAASMALARGSLLLPRTIQSPATCTLDFSWMDNAENDSPCQVAAQVNAICNGGNWIVPALNASFHYALPDPASGTATFCTCSWASYNLISACTICQNQEFASENVQFTVYTANCAGKLSNTYFPSNITLPSGVAIPAWAGTDPSTWTNGLFNVSAAKATAAKDQPDLLGTTQTKGKKSSNVGAIVGGVIGGLVVIAAAAAVAFYMLRRQRQAPRPGPPHSISEKPLHMRSISDVTTNSGFQQGYTTLSSTPLNHPASPTIMTHNTSIRSVPYFSSVVGSTVPHGTASPPPGRQAGSPPPANREDIIEPFTSPPSNNHNHADRKQSNGAFPVYDPPTAPPMRMEISRPITPTQRTRFNPPAYEESTPDRSGTGTPTRPPHRGKQPSSDTTHSMTSTGHAQRPAVDHSPNSSASGMANIVGQMGIAPSGAQTGGNAIPQGHGRQASASVSRDEKRKPTEESFSARDIA